MSHRDTEDTESEAVGVPPLENPFDRLAADYDEDFSSNPVGRVMREAVWRRIEACFQPGQTILELNCGTGEDALRMARHGLRVLATDLSARMVEIARVKVAQRGLESVVEVRRMALEELFQLRGQRFDGALSNMGGLNCVEDLRPVAQALADCLPPAATALLCVMGPLVPWEWAWFWHQGERERMFRRLEKGGTPWRGLTIRYPSIGRLRRIFGPSFRRRRVNGIGFLLPPPFATDWIPEPARLQRLALWERRLQAVPPFPWLSDHYLLELERR